LQVNVATDRGMNGVHNRSAKHGYELSVVVPTRNEAGNVGALRDKLSKTLTGLNFEVVVVDDSDDGETRRRLRAASAANRRWTVIERPVNEQTGLGTAVVAGIAAARGDAICVMDGDLQHPPEILPRLLDPVIHGESQLAVATRYRDGGRVDGLDGRTRRIGAASARHAVHTLVPRSRPVSDPLGGFFAVERSVIDDVDLRPNDCKVLLEIVARGQWTRGHEVPYTFAKREHGSSKSGPRDAVRLGAYLVRVAAAAGSRVLETAGCRVLLALGLIGLAYGYSLRTLVGAWSPSDAATASSLVPLLAAALFLAFARPKESDPAIRDRRADYILGLALLTVALSLLWAHRVDPASLPFFVTGVVAILFGAGAVWRLRFPLMFLLLAWPPVLRAVARAVSAPLGDTTHAIARPMGAWVGDIHVGVDEFTVANQTVRVAPGGNATAIVLVVVLVALACSLVRLPGVTRRLAFVACAATVAWFVNLGCLLFAISAGNLGLPGLARAAVGTPAIVVASAIAVALVLLGLPRLARRRPTRGGIRALEWDLGAGALRT
jgi:dolichol-phosphate mannosyltransferase